MINSCINLLSQLLVTGHKVWWLSVNLEGFDAHLILLLITLPFFQQKSATFCEIVGDHTMSWQNDPLVRDWQFIKSRCIWNYIKAYSIWNWCWSKTKYFSNDSAILCNYNNCVQQITTKHLESPALFWIHMRAPQVQHHHCEPPANYLPRQHGVANIN